MKPRSVSRGLSIIAVFAWPLSALAEMVSDRDFGPAWPLTIPSGDLQCEMVRFDKQGIAPRPAVTFAPTGGGKRYGVNGAAVSLGRGPSIDEIVRQENKGTLSNGQPFLLPASLQPLIERGLKLCSIAPAPVRLDPGHDVQSSSGDSSIFSYLGLAIVGILGCVFMLRAAVRPTVASEDSIFPPKIGLGSSRPHTRQPLAFKRFLNDPAYRRWTKQERKLEDQAYRSFLLEKYPASGSNPLERHGGSFDSEHALLVFLDEMDRGLWPGLASDRPSDAIAAARLGDGTFRRNLSDPTYRKYLLERYPPTGGDPLKRASLTFHSEESLLQFLDEKSRGLWPGR